MTVKTTLTLSVATLVLLLLASIATTSVILDSQKSDGLQINLAGRQRMLSQRMTKEALQIAGAADAETHAAACARFAKTTGLFDRTLTALIDGGTTMGTTGDEVELPPAADIATVEALTEGRATWQGLAGPVAAIAAGDVGTPEFAASLDRLLATNLTLLKQMNAATGAFQGASDAKLGTLTRVQWAAVLVAVLAAAATLWVVKRRVSDPLQRAVDFAETVASGDLTAMIDTGESGEIGKLIRVLDGMVTQLRGTVQGITSAAGGLDGSAATLVDDSNRMAGVAENVDEELGTVVGSMERMAANMYGVMGDSESMGDMVNTVAAAIEELSSSIREISGNTSQTASIADQAAQLAHTASMEIGELDRTAEQIGSVVDMINGIASKTNLLSLNAAIEASSAGEAGKGFAVVANEVKELANQTTGATEEISSQVAAMQARTSQAVGVIRQIAEIVNEVKDYSSSVAAAVEEQSAAVAQVSHNVQDSARSATAVAASVSEAANYAGDVAMTLNGTSNSVREITAQVRCISGTAVADDGQEHVSARDLQVLASNLSSSVGWFRT